MAAPTVSTDAASSITPKNATLNGTISATGGETVTGWGFRINTSASDSGAWDINVPSAISYPQSVSLITRGLTEGRTYYCKFYAENADGTTWGSWASFDTLLAGSHREISVTLYHGTGWASYSEGEQANKVSNYQLEMDENRPKKLTIMIDNNDPTPTVNLLNSSCAVWYYETGALARGDRVRARFYDLYGGTLTTYVEGRISNLSQDRNGKLTVEAWDDLQVLEMKKNIGRPIYNAFRDRKCYDVSSISGNYRALTGVTDSNILTPLKWLGLALTDVRIDLHDSGSKTELTTLDIDNDTDFVAQGFIPPGNALVGVKFSYNTSNYSQSGATAKVRVEIRPAGSDGKPSSTVIAYAETNVGANDSETEVSADMCSSGEPVWLEPGMLYFVVLKGNITPDNPAGYMHFYFNDDWYDDLSIEEFWGKNDSGSVTGYSGSLYMQIDLTDYEEINEQEYEVLESSDRILIMGSHDTVTLTEDPAYYTVYRGAASYYYGSVTGEAICQALIERSGILVDSVSSNLDETSSIFDGRGKTLGDCMRAVLDIFETGGSWSGYQKVVGSYLDTGTPTVKVGKRQKVGDTSIAVFSHPNDSSNDWEHMITDINLKKTIRGKYTEVRVNGQALDGTPVFASVSDRAVSGSLAVAMGGHSEILEVNDNSIRSLYEAHLEAARILKSVNRDLWEGSIVLDGFWPLFDLDSSSDTFGSGRIITLNYSDMGISSVQLKVKSMVLTPTTTEIYVNSEDPVVLNKTLMDRRVLSEYLSSSVDPDVLHLTTYIDSTISGSTLYMELGDSSGNALAEQERVECTTADGSIISDTTLNLKKITAVFKRYNGHGVVEYLKVYDAITGGSLITSQDLYRVASSVAIDERIDKRRGQTVIVEITGKVT